MSGPRCTDSQQGASVVMHQAGSLTVLDSEHHRQLCEWCGALLVNAIGSGLVGRATPVGAWLILDGESGTVRVIEPWGGELDPVSVTGLPQIGEVQSNG